MDLFGAELNGLRSEMVEFWTKIEADESSSTDKSLVERWWMVESVEMSSDLHERATPPLAPDPANCFFGTVRSDASRRTRLQASRTTGPKLQNIFQSWTSGHQSWTSENARTSFMRSLTPTDEPSYCSLPDLPLLRSRKPTTASRTKRPTKRSTGVFT